MKAKIRVYLGGVIWIITFWGIFNLAQWSQKKPLQNWHVGSTKLNQWLPQKVSEFQYLMSPLDIEILFPTWIEIRVGDKLLLNGKKIGIVYSKGVKTHYCPKCKIEVGNVELKKCTGCQAFMPVKKFLQQRYLVVARIYKSHQTDITSQTSFTLKRTPANPGWVVTTLLPKERYKEIGAILGQYWDIHENQIRALWPLFLEMGQDSYQKLKQDLPQILSPFKDRFSKKIKEFRNDYFEQKIVPVIDEVVWPMIVQRTQPVLQPIARKMWKKFPKFKLVWLWMYQSLPGTENDHVKKNVEKYFKEEALPILRENRPKLEKITTEVLLEAIKNPKIKEVFFQAIRTILLDPQFLSLGLEIIQKNKERIIAHIQTRSKNKKLRSAMAEISHNFEPYLIEMINLVLVDQNRHIRPEFAKVLRRQILFKDKYCIEVKSGPGSLDITSFQGIINY